MVPHPRFSSWAFDKQPMNTERRDMTFYSGERPTRSLQPIGPGKCLFAQGTVPTGLALVKTKTTPNGVMMSIYRRVGKI